MSAAKEAPEKIAAAKDRILDVAYRDGLRLRTNQMSPFQFREHLGYEIDNLIVEARAAFAPKLAEIRELIHDAEGMTGDDDDILVEALAAIDGLMKE